METRYNEHEDGIRLDSKGNPIPGEHWLTVMLLGSGYAAVELWMNDEEKDLGPFTEPWQTGIGRYRTRREAEVEAEQWAESDELPIWPAFAPQPKEKSAMAIKTVVMFKDVKGNLHETEEKAKDANGRLSLEHHLEATGKQVWSVQQILDQHFDWTNIYLMGTNGTYGPLFAAEVRPE